MNTTPQNKPTIESHSISRHGARGMVGRIGWSRSETREWSGEGWHSFPNSKGRGESVCRGRIDDGWLDNETWLAVAAETISRDAVRTIPRTSSVSSTSLDDARADARARAVELLIGATDNGRNRIEWGSTDYREIVRLARNTAMAGLRSTIRWGIGGDTREMLSICFPDGRGEGNDAPQWDTIPETERDAETDPGTDTHSAAAQWSPLLRQIDAKISDCEQLPKDRATANRLRSLRDIRAALHSLILGESLRDAAIAGGFSFDDTRNQSQTLVRALHREFGSADDIKHGVPGRV